MNAKVLRRSLGGHPSERSRLVRRGGAILIAVIIATFMLTVLGLVLAQVTTGDLVASAADYSAEEALNAADGGIDYAIALMNNGVANPPAGPYSLPGSGASFSLATGPANSRYGTGAIQISSVGSKDSATATAIAIVTAGPGGTSTSSISPWSYAILAKGHQTDVMGQDAIVGGSLCMLGTDISSSTKAIDLSYGAHVVNNYDDFVSKCDQWSLGEALVDTAPPLPKDANGKSSLGAQLRVKNGLVGLSGGTEIGIPGSSSSDAKTITGCYVGSGGSAGFSCGWGTPASFIYSDNGYVQPYPATAKESFPDVSDPYPSTDPVTGQPKTYTNYAAFLADHAMTVNTVLPGQSEPGSWSGASWHTSKSCDNVAGDIIIEPDKDSYGIAWTWQISDSKGNMLELSLPNGSSGNGYLYIKGLIHATGNIIINTAYRTCYVIGSGTLVADGNISIQGQFVPNGAYNGPGGTGGFPNNAMGLVSYNNLYIGLGPGASQALPCSTSKWTSNPVTSVPGACYAETMTSIGAEAYVLGGIVTKDFSWGRNGGVVQSPGFAGNLPPGLPGASAPGPVVYTLKYYYDMPAGGVASGPGAPCH